MSISPVRNQACEAFFKNDTDSAGGSHHDPGDMYASDEDWVVLLGHFFFAVCDLYSHLLPSDSFS